MGILEIKSDLHKILDRIEDEQLLIALHAFLKLAAHSNPYWDNLTQNQKEEIYRSYQDSKDSSTLLNWDELMKKYQ